MLGGAAIALWFFNYAAPQFFNWPFFVLLFGTGIVSIGAKLFQDVVDGPFMDRPMWTVLYPNAQVIVSLINVPLYWSSMIVSIYGFFILPWYTVVICTVVDLIVGGLFGGVVLMPIIKQFSVTVGLLVSYVVAAAAALWYRGFLVETRTHVLDLGSYLGIAFCVCLMGRRLFLVFRVLGGRRFS
jgi:hypothetical protein